MPISGPSLSSLFPDLLRCKWFGWCAESKTRRELRRAPAESLQALCSPCFLCHGIDEPGAKISLPPISFFYQVFCQTQEKYPIFQTLAPRASEFSGLCPPIHSVMCVLRPHQHLEISTRNCTILILSKLPNILTILFVAPGVEGCSEYSIANLTCSNEVIHD